MPLPRHSLLALLLALAGCATVGMMQQLPADAGEVARYAAPPDTLVAVAEEALGQQDLRIADSSAPDNLTRIVIASRSPGLLSNGELARVRIGPDSGGLTTVRVVTRSGYLLDWAHRNGAPRILQAIDARLVLAALGPWPGMRVQAKPHVGSAVIGTVVRMTTDTLILQGGPDGAPRSFAISALDGLAVSRGSYRHTGEGVLIGALVGGVLGGLLGKTESSDYFQGLSAISNVSWGLRRVRSWAAPWARVHGRRFGVPCRFTNALHEVCVYISPPSPSGGMADATDSKSVGGNPMRVRLSPRASYT
jgi:hypothetical protein